MEPVVCDHIHTETQRVKDAEGNDVTVRYCRQCGAGIE